MVFFEEYGLNRKTLCPRNSTGDLCNLSEHNLNFDKQLTVPYQIHSSKISCRLSIPICCYTIELCKMSHSEEEDDWFNKPLEEFVVPKVSSEQQEVWTNELPTKIGSSSTSNQFGPLSDGEFCPILIQRLDP